MIYARRLERIKKVTLNLAEFRELDGRVLLGRGGQSDKRVWFAVCSS